MIAMIISIERNSIILMLLLLYGSNILAQVPFRRHNTVTDTLISKRVMVSLPDKYKKNVTKYDEGIFVDYLLRDGSAITIFQGALQKVPLLTMGNGYNPERIDTIGNKIISKGIKKGKVWREDRFEGIVIYYRNVTFDKRALYDEVLDNLNILPYPLRK